MPSAIGSYYHDGCERLCACVSVDLFSMSISTRREFDISMPSPDCVQMHVKNIPVVVLHDTREPSHLGVKKLRSTVPCGDSIVDEQNTIIMRPEKRSPFHRMQSTTKKTSKTLHMTSDTRSRVHVPRTVKELSCAIFFGTADHVYFPTGWNGSVERATSPCQKVYVGAIPAASEENKCCFPGFSHG